MVQRCAGILSESIWLLRRNGSINAAERAHGSHKQRICGWKTTTWLANESVLTAHAVPQPGLNQFETSCDCWPQVSSCGWIIVLKRKKEEKKKKQIFHHLSLLVLAIAMATIYYPPFWFLAVRCSFARAEFSATKKRTFQIIHTFCLLINLAQGGPQREKSSLNNLQQYKTFRTCLLNSCLRDLSN